MDLEEGQLDDADKALDRAMRVVNKDKLPPLEVYTLRASLEMSRGGNPDQWIKRILDYNPRYGAVYQQLAHFEIMRRRYKEATRAAASERSKCSRICGPRTPSWARTCCDSATSRKRARICKPRTPAIPTVRRR